MKQKQRVFVTERELLIILMSIDKPTFTHIVSKTKVRMNKGGNPYFDKVTKHSKGFTYEGDSIERELFRSYEVKRSESSRQPQENKHKPQSFMVSSIEEMTLNGTEYVVVGR